MILRRLAVAALAGPALCGCSPPPSPAPLPTDQPAPPPQAVPAVAEAIYDCTPGPVALRVQFDNRADTAAILLGGATITMTGQRPASGIWYAGDGYELRGKGRQARFALPDGSARDCVAR